LTKKKSWREKLEIKKEPKIVDDPKGRGRMLVPTPLLVDALTRKIPRGKLLTVKDLREKLARDFGADLTCPLATGWFIRIVAEAAEEDLREGRKKPEEVTPYWRVIKSNGSLNDKFPGGAEAQARHLREEGHEILPGRKGKLVVKDFEGKLANYEQSHNRGRLVVEKFGDRSFKYVFTFKELRCFYKGSMHPFF